MRASLDDQILPGVRLVRVPFELLRLDTINSYIIENEDEALIVDPGADDKGSFDHLVSELKARGTLEKKLSVFLTHLHFDHAGLVNQLAPEGCRVYVGCEGLEPAPDEGVILETLLKEGVPRYEADPFVSIRKGINCFLDAERLDLIGVKEGDPICIAERTLRVVDTAGHTDHHRGLLLPEEKALISGDQILYNLSPAIDMFFDGRNSVDRCLSNMKKVREMDIDHLLVAHGEIRNGHNERINWLIKHHEERCLEAVDILKKEPYLSGYEITRRIIWNVPFRSPGKVDVMWSRVKLPQRFCIVMQGLSIVGHLHAEGKIGRRIGSDGVCRYYAE